MPRPRLEPTDRFRIVFDTIESRVGRMLKLLAENGGNVVSCNVITDIPRYQTNKQGDEQPDRKRRKDGASERMQALALDRLKKGQTTLREFMQIAKDNNLNPNTVSQNITPLVANGQIKRVTTGLYELAKSAPKKAAPKKTTKKVKPKKRAAYYPKNVTRLVRDHLKARAKSKPATRKLGARDAIVAMLQKTALAPGRIAGQLVKRGYGDHTTSSALSDMTKQGRIVRNDDGTYSLPKSNGPITAAG